MKHGGLFNRHKWSSKNPPLNSEDRRKCLKCGQMQVADRDVDVFGEGYWKWVNLPSVCVGETKNE